MTLNEVQEVILRAINGLDATLGSRIDPLYLEQLIHQSRIEAIRILYNGSKNYGALKKVDPMWMQEFTVDIIDGDQDDNYDYLVFDVPPPAQISRGVGGLIYVGSTKKTKGFHVAQTRGEIADLIARGLLDNGRDVAVMWEQDGLKVWGNDNLKKLRIAGVFQDPTEVPNYLIDEDAYPVSNDLVNLIRDLIVNQVSLGLRQPPDVVADGGDTSTINANRQNIR